MHSNSCRSLSVLLLFVLVGGTAGAEEEKKPSKVVAKFLGDTVVGLLKEADSVEAFRVDPRNEPKAGDAKVGSYKVVGKPVTLKKEVVSQLRAVFYNEKTYEFGSSKKCEFNPHHAVVLKKGKSSVTFIICFECDEFSFEAVNDKGVKSKGFEDFDASRAALVKFFKAAFPKHKNTQALKDKS